MRISDWSSDVCSSDLAPSRQSARFELNLQQLEHVAVRVPACTGGRRPVPADNQHCAATAGQPLLRRGLRIELERSVTRKWLTPTSTSHTTTSEEHTSELPSQITTPYPVFCLKKKT